MSGLDLAHRFYDLVVRPRLDGTAHAAALLGSGSEVLGYDDTVSTDHDFGPRVQLFVADPASVAPWLAGLPESFEGHRVDASRTEVTTVEAFFSAWLTTDPVAKWGVADWLLTPTQVLASLTAGAVFADPEGELARRRRVLRWYPDDVWRYALAAAWQRVGQEEAFVGRAGSTGDELGSRVVAARLVRELMRLAFLVERRWCPYGKWFGRAFNGLDISKALTPPLTDALTADRWREREAAVCAAGSILGAATNALGLADPVDPTPRPYYTRDIQVIDGGRFTRALTSKIIDAELVSLLERLGERLGTARLPGTIDQLTDSTDVLYHADRRRTAARLLGLRSVTDCAV
jgi:hypothetical protein